MTAELLHPLRTVTCLTCDRLPRERIRREGSCTEQRALVWCAHCARNGAVPIGVGCSLTDARDHWFWQRAQPLRIIGFDPGFASLGIFVLELTGTSMRCVYRSNGGSRPEHTDDHRFGVLSDQVESAINVWRPAAVAFERQAGVAVGKEQAGKGNADRLKVITVTGIIRHAARVRRLPCYEVATQTGRRALFGKGQSRGKTKQETKARLQQVLGVGKLSLHESDAGAVALGGWMKHLEVLR